MTNVKSIYGHENNFPTINSCHFIHKTWGGVWGVIAISSIYIYIYIRSIHKPAQANFS